MKSERVNFCLGELFLKLLARIGEWHHNLSEKTEGNVFTRVCHSVHEGGGLCPGGQRPISRQRPPRTVKSGRYASYWNAFLFTCCKESPGRYLPACLIAHTGTRSVTSPLAARSIKSFFKGGKG